MTLQSSGAISLANVNTELGRSSTASISLGETAVRTLAGVASGPISLSNLYGKSNGATISLAASYDYFANSTRLNGFKLAADGYVYGGAGTNPTTNRGAWISPIGSQSSYECYATLSSGTITSGTLNTWLNLGTDRIWYSSTPLSGYQEGYVSIQIRKVGTTTVLATTTVHLGWDGGGAVMTL